MENGSGSLSSPNPLQKIYIHIRGNMLPATSKINVTQSDSNAILASFNIDKLWEQNTLPAFVKIGVYGDIMVSPASTKKIYCRDVDKRPSSSGKIAWQVHLKFCGFFQRIHRPHKDKCVIHSRDTMSYSGLFQIYTFYIVGT